MPAVVSCRRPALLTGLLLLAACSHQAQLDIAAGTGPTPILPEPRTSLIPTVNIAPARGWADGEKPKPAAGLSVTPFATDLDHPRWLFVLPNGDVLVAETNAPARPRDATGIRGWVRKKIMARAGAGGASANRITLLRDTDDDGVADERHVFLSGLNAPFGMALVDQRFYVANTDRLDVYAYESGQTRITDTPTLVSRLPAGAINHHWTKNVIADRDTLYVTVGSNSNAAENGLAVEQGRAAIWAIDRVTGAYRLFATGLRNPNGMAFVPQPDGSRQLWTVVNERDELGGDLVPDYMTSVVDGGFYGWPYSYYGDHVDERVQPANPARVAEAIVPDYALGAHTASLGLAYSAGKGLDASFGPGMFVGQHGSWNRTPRSGYRVLFVPFTKGHPDGPPRVVLDGFVDANGHAHGRPVGVAMDRDGAVLVADDVGDTVWRISAHEAESDNDPARMLQRGTKN
ncbi:sorbosone dehydrogenase family protein [Salinisphaera sp. T31B1]|uniref:PQQ-dependent sugar dehydrogenase n=1 Tax=Salinisphaera sp. T31B1 TaxID=727963 RepID=UPI003342397C